MPILQEFDGFEIDFSIAGTAITCFPNIIQHANNVVTIDTMPICTGPCPDPHCKPATVATLFSSGTRNIFTEKYVTTPTAKWRLRDSCQAASIWVKNWNNGNVVEIEDTANKWVSNNKRFGGTVLWEVKQAYNYFLTHGRNSYDNAEGTVEAYINAADTDGAFMTNNGTMEVGAEVACQIHGVRLILLLMNIHTL
ncbi:MAG: hypothetical protein IPO27_12435 [Bacteroidetes bacterium]|nr:hypothetical protein [Bacteroidota bacterium]